MVAASSIKVGQTVRFMDDEETQTITFIEVVREGQYRFSCTDGHRFTALEDDGEAFEVISEAK